MKTTSYKTGSQGSKCFVKGHTNAVKAKKTSPKFVNEQNDVKEKNHPKENEMWKYMYKKIDECLKNWYFITNKTAALCGEKYAATICTTPKEEWTYGKIRYGIGRRHNFQPLHSV